MTSDVGPVIRQWTMGSALSHLRGFVTGVHVELDEVRRYIVRQPSAPFYAAARTSRIAARSPAAAVAPPPVAPAPVAAEETASPVSMEVDQTEVIIQDCIYWV